MDKKNRFLHRENPKVKINYVNNAYWLVPGFFSFLGKNWSMRPYKNLNDLIYSNNFDLQPQIFNFNNDKNFFHFNNVQKVLNNDLFLENPQFNNSSFYSFEKNNLIIIFDKKSLKDIQEGFCPGFNNEFYKKLESKNIDEIVKIYWRKNGYVSEEKTN